jgi:hypothetical protein
VDPSPVLGFAIGAISIEIQANTCSKKNHNFGLIFVAHQRILIGSQICKRDVNLRLILDIIYIHYFVVSLIFRYLIVVKILIFL